MSDLSNQYDPQPVVFVPERAPRKPRKAAFITAGTAVGVVLLGGAFGAASGSTDPDNTETFVNVGSDFDLKGEVTLVDYQTSRNHCIGTGGFKDIRSGAPVQILDRAGAVLALTELKLDKAASHATALDLGTGGGPTDLYCIYRFALGNLPTADVYNVHIGNGRGPLTYSHQHIVSKNGEVSLILGSGS